jgi:peroxiredoxin
LQQHKSELEDMGYAIVGVSKDKPETPKKNCG